MASSSSSLIRNKDSAKALDPKAFAAITWILLSLALLTTFLRLLARLRVLKSFGLDDSLATLGWVSSLPQPQKIKKAHIEVACPSLSLFGA
jgi:hypothetical protein